MANACRWQLPKAKNGVQELDDVGIQYLEMGKVSEIDESEGEGENVVEEESNGGNGGSSESVDKLFDESSERVNKFTHISTNSGGWVWRVRMW